MSLSHPITVHFQFQQVLCPKKKIDWMYFRDIKTAKAYIKLQWVDIRKTPDAKVGDRIKNVLNVNEWRWRNGGAV